MSRGQSSTDKTAFAAVISAILRNPIVVRVKHLLRDALWTRHASQLENPRVPADVRTVLFICLGNICRSPFAGALLAKRLAEAGLDHVQVESAGLRASADKGPPSTAVAAAREYACLLESRRPVQVTEAMLRGADLIIVMELEHVNAIREQWPDLASRAFLLALFEHDRGSLGAFERINILDPFGRDRTEFDRCYRRIDNAIRGLVAAIQQSSTEPLTKRR